MSDVSLRKVVIIGVGLIGGSFALALRANGKVQEVVGIGRGAANLERALELRIVDRVHGLQDDWADDTRDADMILVATPVAQMPAVFASLAGKVSRSAIVMDAGSTKEDVIVAAREHLGASMGRFVPAHPIAGGERTGADAATAKLFDRRRVVLTPVTETEADALAFAVRLWKACGADVERMNPDRHDIVLAAVSHMPHLLAFALVADIAARPDAQDYFRHAAGGFRDFTRLAGSSPEMWRDISFANRDALHGEIARFRDRLDDMDRMLTAGDRVGLEALFRDARNARNGWLEQREADA
jgi:prephenate dehydrogenase